MRDSTLRQVPSRADSRGTTTAVSRSGPDSWGPKLWKEYYTPSPSWPKGFPLCFAGRVNEQTRREQS
jgi:hypothetical protein